MQKPIRAITSVDKGDTESHKRICLAHGNVSSILRNQHAKRKKTILPHPIGFRFLRVVSRKF